MFDVIDLIFGQQQLVIVNYACGFNQTETGKYFERIIISISIITQVIIEILALSLAENGVIFRFIQQQNQCACSDWSISYGLLCQ